MGSVKNECPVPDRPNFCRESVWASKEGATRYLPRTKKRVAVTIEISTQNHLTFEILALAPRDIIIVWGTCSEHFALRFKFLLVRVTF